MLVFCIGCPHWSQGRRALVEQHKLEMDADANSWLAGKWSFKWLACSGIYTYFTLYMILSFRPSCLKVPTRLPKHWIHSWLSCPILSSKLTNGLGSKLMLYHQSAVSIPIYRWLLQRLSFFRNRRGRDNCHQTRWAQIGGNGNDVISETWYILGTVEMLDTVLLCNVIWRL